MFQWIRRVARILGRGAAAYIRDAEITADEYWQLLGKWVIGVGLVLIALVIFTGKLGHEWVNMLALVIWVLFIAGIYTRPRHLIAVITAGTAYQGLTERQKAFLQKVEDGLKQGLAQWHDIMLGAGVFGTAYFITNYLFPTSKSLPLTVALLGTLVGLGLITWFWKEGKWYKKYVHIVVFLSLAHIMLSAYYFEEIQKRPTGMSKATAIWKGLKQDLKNAGHETVTLFSDEWVVKENVRCSPGKCTVDIKEAGKYQFRPRETMDLREVSGGRRTCEAKGISLRAVWGHVPAFIDEFERDAPIKNGQLCSLVAKVGGAHIDLPKEDFTFWVEKPGTIEFLLNAPARYQQYFVGQLTGDLKKAL